MPASPGQKPALVLLPNVLGEGMSHQAFLPASVDKAVAGLDGLIAESIPGGRRFLSRFETAQPAHLIPVALASEDPDFLLAPIKQGQRWGLVSDCGLPCIADPGSAIVARARALGIEIRAFSGPSAIMLALMLSGLEGQRFAFHGYLSKESAERGEQLKALQKRSKEERSAQIVIEAPHRNQYLLEAMWEHLSDTTRLCVAWDLTLSSQGVLTYPIATWKKSPMPALSKRHAIFLFQA